MPVAVIDSSFLACSHNPGLYWGSEPKGFGVRVASNGRVVSFIFQKSGGRRVTLGSVRDGMKLGEARKLAHAASGATPEGRPGPCMTLRTALDRHIASMEKRGLSQKSMKLMRYEVERHCEHLLGTRLDRISSGDIEAVHDKVTRPARPGGKRRPVSGNRIVKILRTLYNSADLKTAPFPVSRQKWDNMRNPERKGTRPVHDLRAFGAALRTVDNPFRRAWWEAALVTGLRRGDLQSLRWADVDALRDGWLFLREPKGGELKSFEIPITRRLREILDGLPRIQGNPHVFPGVKSGDHLREPGKVAGATRHMMRATYITRAESKLGCPLSVLKTLVNHVSESSGKGAGVTGGYITPDDAVLVEWAEKIADSLHADICDSK